MAGKKKKRASQRRAERTLEAVLKTLADLVERFRELAESRPALSNTKKIHGAGKERKGIYGFTVKVGLGDEGPSLEPFGNIRRDLKSGRTAVQEVREPLVDIFEEDDHLLLEAELPGIREEDVRIAAKDDVLTISAERGDRKYRKEVLFPGDLSPQKMRVSCREGILEIRCPKWRPGEKSTSKRQRSRSSAKPAGAGRRE
jgi:HSP20 family protein